MDRRTDPGQSGVVQIHMRSSPAADRAVDAPAIIVRALRDPIGSAPPSPGADVAALLTAAAHHRVLLLLGWTLRAAGTLEDWPAEFIQAFQRAERDAVTVDCLRHAELVTMLAEL